MKEGGSYELKLQLQELSSKLSNLVKKINQQNEIITSLKLKNKELEQKIAKGSNTPKSLSTNKKLKLNIDKYIKVVDKCIIYLENQI